MVRVTIELLVRGDKTDRRHLGTVEIANDGTGTTELGNYSVRLSKFGRPMSAWKKGVVKGFARRRRGPFDLLLLALINTVGPRVLDGPTIETLEGGGGEGT